MVLPAPNIQQPHSSDSFDDISQAMLAAIHPLQSASSEQINAVLQSIADGLNENQEDILKANQNDIDSAREKNISSAMIDRLTLTPQRIKGIAQGLSAIIDLGDPTGKVLWQQTRPNGLKIERISIPFGILGMIYESRPNVTIDAAALALKSRNVILLRGGSESLQSSLALHRIIESSLEKNGLPKSCVSMIKTPNRDLVGKMLQAHDVIDVIIPRGGKGLIERIRSEATMPVFSHLDGLCHIYIDHTAKPDIALTVPLNAKTRRPGICGAMETLLLDKKIAPVLAEQILEGLSNAGCTIYGDEQVRQIYARAEEATQESWRTEYLDMKLSCRFVDGVDEAINHINTYGSHHTDSILSEDTIAVQKFLQEVDSGIVMHNTSTQFADGGEFGMGAEIGIATGKFHARGPVGLDQLCTYKYQVHGRGQVRP